MKIKNAANCILNKYTYILIFILTITFWILSKQWAVTTNKFQVINYFYINEPDQVISGWKAEIYQNVLHEYTFSYMTEKEQLSLS